MFHLKKTKDNKYILKIMSSAGQVLSSSDSFEDKDDVYFLIDAIRRAVDRDVRDFTI